jgi:hypothetical protein
MLEWVPAMTNHQQPSLLNNCDTTATSIREHLNSDRPPIPANIPANTRLRH